MDKHAKCYAIIKHVNKDFALFLAVYKFVKIKNN